MNPQHLFRIKASIGHLHPKRPVVDAWSTSVLALLMALSCAAHAQPATPELPGRPAAATAPPQAWQTFVRDVKGSPNISDALKLQVISDAARMGATAPTARFEATAAPANADTLNESLPANLPANMTRQAVRVMSTGRPLSDLQRQIELALGVRMVLSGLAGDAVLQGDIAGSSGLDFVKELATRARLEWALGTNEVFLAPEGSAKPTAFNAPSAEMANLVAARANQEFGLQGSNIRVAARKEEVIVTALPNWVTQVAALRLPALIEQVQVAQTNRDRLRRRNPGMDDRKEDPLALEVFRLNNAYVDDKRLAVGSNVLVIPGVARLFRQFTGMSGGASDSVRPASVVAADPGFGRVERMDRLDALTGARTLRNEAERNDPNYRDRGLTRTERTDMAQDELDLAAARSEQFANMPAAIGDSRMNALVIRDRGSRMEMHRALIKVLDQPTDMVQLDAFVIDIKASRMDEFGLGLSWAGSTSVNSPRFNPGGANLANNANVILQGMRGAQLLANIRALESSGDTEMLTVPSVVTLNNLEATFSARENFYVRVAGNQDASLTRVTAETLLKVTPLVSGDGGSSQDRRIRLLISVQDGSVDGSTSAVVDSLPRTLENQISTQAVVKGGDTLVIGGQVVRKRINSTSGIPILSRIPLISKLTNSRSTETAQFIRVYVVRPRLLGEDSSFAGNSAPLPEEDPYSHPSMGKIRNLMLGNSITPNRPDEPEAVPAAAKNRPTVSAAPNTITLTLSEPSAPATPAEASAFRSEPVAAARQARPELAPVNLPAMAPAKPDPGPIAVAVAGKADAAMTLALVSAKPAGTQAQDAAVNDAALRQALELWRNAWSARDLPTYFSMYDDKFLPTKGVSRQAWTKTRSARISAKEKIDLSIQNLRVQINGSKATVKFTQVYSDERLNLTDHKTMLWQKLDGRWLIQREFTN